MDHLTAAPALEEMQEGEDEAKAAPISVQMAIIVEAGVAISEVEGAEEAGVEEQETSVV